MEKQKNAAEILKGKYHKAPFVANLKDLLYRSADRYAKRSAFKLKDKNKNIYSVSYQQFKEDVVSLGTAFLNLGLAGKKIAVMGKNSYTWATSYLAASIVGVVVPIDKELHPDDVINFLNVSEASVLLTDEKLLSKILEAKDKIKNTKTIFIDFDSNCDKEYSKSYSLLKSTGKKAYEEGNHSFDEIQIDPDEMHILLFTSGTTGTAKGVCLSHKNITSNIMSTYGIVKVKSSDQVLSILPIHHTYECTLGFLLVIYAGGCIAYCDGLRYITKNISEYHPTVVLCVPLLLENVHKKIMKTLKDNLPEKYTKKEDKILESLPGIMRFVVKRRIKNSLGGRLRAFIVGAAACNPNIVKTFDQVGVKALQGYGLTECSPLVAGNNDYYINYAAAGLPIPNVEYKIKNPDNTGVGEILVKGPNVMLGYYQDEEATKKVIQDGWFHTGDLGRIDEDGWLYITGRCKSVIVTKNGKNIYPEEIEYYLNDNPIIEEALVTGIQHENDDDTYVNAQIFPNMEAIKEILKVNTPTKEEIYATVGDVIASINKKLPNYKHIKSYKVREEEFEKTTTKKIKRYGDNMKNN